MGGLKLTWDSEHMDFDLTLTGKNLEREQGVETYVAISLFTDLRARARDRIPGEQDDRRGWWADEFAEDGDPFGSRLWLLADAKASQATLIRAQQFARAALAWMVPAQLASKVAVAAEYSDIGTALILDTAITRPGSASPHTPKWEVQLAME